MKSSARVACMLASASLLAVAAPGTRATEEVAPGPRSGTRARPIERPGPLYPESESSLGHEGWVIASFVVHVDTVATLQALSKHSEVPEAMPSTATRIRELETGDQPFSVDGVIGEPKREGDGIGFWSHSLLRRTPGIEGGEGGIDRVELHCDSQRVVAQPEAGRAWRIPEEWGTCSVHVFGQPGTAFQLVEYPTAMAAAAAP